MLNSDDKCIVPVEVPSVPGPSSPGYSPALVAPYTDADPDFTGPIQNVTVAVGREAVLSCSVTDLGQYKVSQCYALTSTNAPNVMR